MRGITPRIEKIIFFSIFFVLSCILLFYVITGENGDSFFNDKKHEDKADFLAIMIVSLAPVFVLILFLIYIKFKEDVAIDPKRWVEEFCDEEKLGTKVILSYFLLAFLISMPTAFVLLGYSVEKVLDPLPIGSNIKDEFMRQNDLSKDTIISDYLLHTVGNPAFLLLTIGPIWLFILRRAKKVEKKAVGKCIIEETRYPSSTTLRYYIISVLILSTFVIFDERGDETCIKFGTIDGKNKAESSREDEKIQTILYTTKMNISNESQTNDDDECINMFEQKDPIIIIFLVGFIVTTVTMVVTIAVERLFSYWTDPKSK